MNPAHTGMRVYIRSYALTSKIYVAPRVMQNYSITFCLYSA